MENRRVPDTLRVFRMCGSKRHVSSLRDSHVVLESLPSAEALGEALLRLRRGASGKLTGRPCGAPDFSLMLFRAFPLAAQTTAEPAQFQASASMLYKIVIAASPKSQRLHPAPLCFSEMLRQTRIVSNASNCNERNNTVSSQLFFF